MHNINITRDGSKSLAEFASEVKVIRVQSNLFGYNIDIHSSQSEVVVG